MASTRFTILEEPELLFAVADEHVFRPLIMAKHHLMVLATNPRHFVAAERSVCRIGMVAVDPDAACLDFTTESIGTVHVTCPHAGPKSVERIVRDGECFSIIFERRNDLLG